MNESPTFTDMKVCACSTILLSYQIGKHDFHFIERGKGSVSFEDAERNLRRRLKLHFYYYHHLRSFLIVFASLSLSPSLSSPPSIHAPSLLALVRRHQSQWDISRHHRQRRRLLSLHSTRLELQRPSCVSNISFLQKSVIIPQKGNSLVTTVL